MLFKQEMALLYYCTHYRMVSLHYTVLQREVIIHCTCAKQLLSTPGIEVKKMMFMSDQLHKNQMSCQFEIVMKKLHICAYLYLLPILV